MFPRQFSFSDHVLDEEELSTILAEDERADATEREVKDDNEQRNGTAGDNTDTVKTDVQENGPGNKQNEKSVLAPTIEKKAITPPTAKAPAPPPYQESRLSQNESSFSNLSPMELIFMGYAKQLQKMPLALQLKTKRKIADIMDEAELKMMEEF